MVHVGIMFMICVKDGNKLLCINLFYLGNIEFVAANICARSAKGIFVYFLLVLRISRKWGCNLASQILLTYMHAISFGGNGVLSFWNL